MAGHATVALLVAVGLGACNSASTSSAVYEVSDEATRAGWLGVEPRPVSIPSQRPIGAAETRTGGGARPTLVNVWASFCAPCVEEMPVLQQAAESGEVAVIGLTRDANQEDAAELVDRLQITFSNYMDAEAEFAIALDGLIPLNSIPATVLVEDGQAVAVHLGALDSVEDALSVAR